MIYVDAAIWFTGERGKKAYCHAWADTLEELHTFMRKIGRKRCWFHRTRDPRLRHYDLDEVWRAKAIEAGAVEVDAKEFVAKRLGKQVLQVPSL